MIPMPREDFIGYQLDTLSIPTKAEKRVQFTTLFPVIWPQPMGEREGADRQTRVAKARGGERCKAGLKPPPVDGSAEAMVRAR
jgi:hypothetical protein